MDIIIKAEQGAGKTIVAEFLAKQLTDAGFPVTIVDGDFVTKADPPTRFVDGKKEPRGDRLGLRLGRIVIHTASYTDTPHVRKYI